MKIHSLDKRPRKRLPSLLAACAGALCIGACIGTASANPSGASVIAGQVTFSRQGNVFTITNSPNAIINWDSFSISAGEMTRFIQQSSSSSVLNRITGQDPSQILGALQSNGRVLLINPNGIVFGAGAQINVAGLVASTLNMTDADFLAGKNRFAAGGAAGNVVNQGAITTPSGGQVFLIAPNVTNTGIITSPGGEVLLAAGHSVQLADSTNPSLHVVVSSPADQALNLGQVIAQGGKIGIYGALVNQGGTLNANSAAFGENGKIVLRASRTTLLETGSVTSATGIDRGGEIQVLGDQVGLMGNARVDVSGRNGGGTALIGGDYQGKNPDVMNAQQVFVGKDATISADALMHGNGGKVIVWGNRTAQAYGAISARGGALSGNGGLIETSGHSLDVAGIRIDAGAAHGKNGRWLLDPFNITINNDGPASLSDVATFSNDNNGEINGALLSHANADIVLQASNDITFGFGVNNVNSAVSLTAQAGNNINVNANLNFAGNITLAANSNAGGSASGSGIVDYADGITPHAGGTLTITDVNRLAPPVSPPRTPPPSADICTIAPNSALCQVLSPPSTGEPAKPVQQAQNSTVNIINTTTKNVTAAPPAPSVAPATENNSASGGGGAASDSKSDEKKEDAKEDKKDEKKDSAITDKTGVKNEPTPKTFCN